MSIELYPSIAKIKRNGVYENLPGFVPETGSVATQQMIATAESSATAQYVHNKGEYFRLNDTLYQAIVKINVGDNIVVGTNCEVAVIGNDLTHVANSIAAYELGIATSSHNTGDYFMVGETMYVATADIQVGDNISTSTNCRKAVVGDELSALQTALTLNSGTERINLTNGYAIYTSGSTYDKTELETTAEYCYCVYPCSAGDKFTVTGTGGYSPRLWAFGDGTNVLSKSKSAETATNKTLIAPTGATEFIYNARLNSTHYCFYGEFLIKRTKEFEALASITGLNTLPIKTKNVFESFTPNSVTYNFTSASTIYNYANYSSSSSVAKNTPPIQIRDVNGNLIYKNLRLNQNISGKTAICAWTFGKDGYYLRNVGFNELYNRTNYFADDEYYAILQLFPSVSDYASYQWIVDNVNIGWLNPNSEGAEYYVGTNGDFATVTEMLTALENDISKKTVYIESGVYDIFTEVGGADYMATLVSTASTLNWRDVCKVVPPNTTLIGIGDVTLTWDATSSDMGSADVAWLFSPLNVSGNCEIENIKVVAKNCRYAVHDETSNLSQYDGVTHKYKNCKFECLQSTYYCGTCYGSGHNKNMKLFFENCEFVNYQNYAWTTHQNTIGQYEASTFVFDNCIFEPSHTNADFVALRFGTDTRNGLIEPVRFNNCYIAGKIMFYSEYTSEVSQGYDVTLVGSTEITTPIYSDNITTKYDLKQYNKYSLS